jgi:hypothetical protein
MDVNKIQIRQEGFVDREITIPIQLTWDYLGLDQSIEEYEANIIEQVVGTGGDFEVDRFPNAPYTFFNTATNKYDEITDIQYEFNFYSGGSLSASTIGVQLSIGRFTTQEIFYYTNNFSNSFFKLDLYDNVDEKRQKNYITIIIPTQQGLKMDAIMQRTPVKIKKPYFVLDYVGDKEGLLYLLVKEKNILRY